MQADAPTYRVDESHRGRREALPHTQAFEAHVRETVERLRGELREMPPVHHEARAELANAEHVLL